ncbi:MAG TPA: NACHT domain-containing protein [Roseiflexaceae bacterium]
MLGSTDDTRTLGQWLTRLRTRSALASADLAALVGVTKRTLLDWERGRTHPNALRLRRLLAALAAHGGFAPGQAYTEAAALWNQANRESKRHLGPFDAAWFDQLLAGQAAPQSGGSSIHDPASVPPRVLVTPVADWSEAADVGTLAHRDIELDTLRRLLDDERRRVVGVIGIGGIGKTSLVVAFGQHAATRNPDTDRGFDTVVFGSLRNAPPLDTLIDSLIHTLAPQLAAAPNAGLDTTITLLLDLLHARRVLLILDQLENILQPGTTTAQYRAGYADYGRLLYRLGEDGHQSCLIVTSREKPGELTELEARGLPAATLTLRGLSEAACQRLLAGRQIRGTDAEWAALAHQFGGNPLALKLVAEPIVERFGGDIGAFLASNVALLERVRALIEQHVKRLSPLELDLLRWLAVAREPIAAADLVAMSIQPVARSYLLEALEGLRRRNLVERDATWPAFSLQPMVMEYVTERLVDQAYAEILAGELQVLRQHALVQASAPKHMQQSQMRALVQPLLDALQRAYTSTDALVARLRQLLAAVRALPRAQQGYADANLLTLLIAAEQDPSTRLDDPGPADHHGAPALPRSEPCST